MSEEKCDELNKAEIIEKTETKDSRLEKEKTFQESEEKNEQSGLPETDERIQENPETVENGNPTDADKIIHENVDLQKSSTGEQDVPDESVEDLLKENTVEETIAAPEPDPPDSLSTDSDDIIPGYLKILQNIYERSDPSDNGAFTLSFDEIRYLASDPEFRLIYPEAAAEMKALMQNMDSS